MLNAGLGMSVLRYRQDNAPLGILTSHVAAYVSQALYWSLFLGLRQQDLREGYLFVLNSMAPAIVGTVVADWTTTMWYDPLIIHKYGFKNEIPVSGYFLRLATYSIVIAVIGVLDWLICSRVLTGLGWISIIFHAIICAVTVPAILVALAIRTEEGQYVWKLFLNQVKLFKKKLGRR